MGGNDVSYNIGKKLKKKNFRVIFIFRKKRVYFHLLKIKLFQ